MSFLRACAAQSLVHLHCRVPACANARGARVRFACSSVRARARVRDLRVSVFVYAARTRTARVRMRVPYTVYPCASAAHVYVRAAVRVSICASRGWV